MKTKRTLILLTLLALIEVGSLEVAGTKVVYHNKALVGSGLRTIRNVDWLRCIQLCATDPCCRSYNFNQRWGLCELNSASLCGCGASREKILVHQKGSVFHQLYKREGLTEERCKQTTSNTNSEIRKSKPIALYPLTKSNPVQDRSKYPNPDANIGKSIDYVTGPTDIAGGATKFHGKTESFVEIPNNKGFLDVRKSITLAAWVYPLSGGSVISYIDLSENKWGVRICAVPDFILTFKLVKRADYNFTKQIDLEMKSNQWNFIAATYDHKTGTAVLWVNDLKKEQNVGKFDLATNHAIFLGSIKKYSFTGRMFCFQIFKKALDKKQLDKAKSLCTKFNE